MTSTSTPDWLRPGEPVVEYTPTRLGSSATGTLVDTTIERVMKRDVVLANGSRYRIDRLDKGGGDWTPKTRLLHAHDPIVARTEAANHQRTLISSILIAGDRVQRAVREHGGDATRQLDDPLATAVAEAARVLRLVKRLADHEAAR